MFSTFITVALFASLVIQGAYAGFAINNPPVVQCQPAEVSWAKTTPPYQLEIVPAEDPCGAALVTVNSNTTTFNYTADIPAGTELIFFVSDSAGNDAWSTNVTVGSSSNNTCIPGASSPKIPATTPTPATTLTPAAPPTYASASASSSSTPSSGIGGVINAGGLSGAPSVRQASTPLLTLTALAAILAMTL